MRAQTLHKIRKIHTFLSVFFAPLLVLFLLTGFWRMAIPEEQRERPGMVRALLEKLSTVHKESYLPRAGVVDPSTAAFKVLVGGLCGALMISILIGLILAWTSARGRWLAPACALALGIIVPMALLWFA